MPLSHVGLQRAAQLTFRILFSLIFIAAGAKHLLAPEAITARLMRSPGFFLVEGLPPTLLVMASGGVLLAGGLALLLGLRTRWAAAALAAVLIPITATVQVGGAEGMGPLLKNVALLGGLLHWAAEGAGPVSLDGWLKQRRRLRPALVGALGALVIVWAAVPAWSAPSGGNNASKGRHRVLLLVQQPPQLKAALATAQEALAGRGFPAREVEVLVCGPAITSLLAGDPMEARIGEATLAGVRVVACGLTLEEKGISRERVSSRVQIVENGLTHALERQSDGFLSVEL